MAEPCLKVQGLYKKFCRDLKRSLWYGLKDVAAELMLQREVHRELRRHEFWALQEIDFELHQGETLGIVGHNGAGKSTLLKLINGLIKPDRGRLEITGRVGALIELGTGFNPILTGRENVYVNGAVLGLSRREIDAKLAQIIDFAEIGDFIDAPVQSYSSGMKVRLGFSVAANMNPEILLIDEVLSVGDASFRQRCLDRLDDYRRSGGTVIFISHNTLSVESICERVMLLDHGRMEALGPASEVIEQYEKKMLELAHDADRRLRPQAIRSADEPAWISDVQCLDEAGQPFEQIEFGRDFEVHFRYETSQSLDDPCFVVGFQQGPGQGAMVSMMVTRWDGIDCGNVPSGSGVQCRVREPNLAPGIYQVHVGVLGKSTGTLGQKWYARMRPLGSFAVEAGPLRENSPNIPGAHIVSAVPPMVLEHDWEIGEP